MPPLKVTVKTSMGTFTCTPDRVVATIDSEHGKKYGFAHELRNGDKVIVSKPIAESLTLEGHIIPTLWARSEQYRHDRKAIFEGDGHDLPTTTRLCRLLSSAAEANGAVSHASATELVHGRLCALPDELHYSHSEVSAWLSNSVMFPERPKALLAVAQMLNANELHTWTEEIIAQEMMPVRRLRAIHSHIRAMLLRPSDHSTNGGNGHPHSGNAHRPRLTSTEELVRLLETEYGDSAFKDFVSTATVLDVSVHKERQQEMHNADSAQDDGLGKRLITFSYASPGQKDQVLHKFGSGSERSMEIEQNLEKRRMLLNALFKAFVPVAEGIETAPVFSASPDGVNLRIRVDMNRKLNDHFSQILTFGRLSTVSGWYASLFTEIWNSNVRDRIKRAIYSSVPESFHKEVDGLPPFSNYLAIFRDVYNNSIIERHIFSFEEFIGLFNLTMDGMKRALPRFITTYENARAAHMTLETWKRGISRELEHAEKYDNALEGNAEFSQLLREASSLQIPRTLVIVQNGNGREELMGKLKEAYGISSFHRR